MKKYLSILFTAIFASMVVFSTTSCSKDDSATDANIVGTWKIVSVESPLVGEDDKDEDNDNEVYWQFKENGTFITVGVYEDSYDVDCSETWRLSGNTLILEEPEEEEVILPLIFTITESTKNSLTLVWAGGIATINFKRVSDSIIEKYL